MIRANGKLLLTGEYFVLDGAEALAVPTRFGQTLVRVPLENTPQQLHWNSYTHTGQLWFTARWLWDNDQFVIADTNDTAAADRMEQLLQSVRTQNPTALFSLLGQQIATRLEFDRSWGLGSSSTLISLLAQITQTDPYRLLDESFGGSGYDLASATAQGPIVYSRVAPLPPEVTPLDWQPAYADNIYFVHLGKKQNSRDGIRYYRELCGTQVTLIDEVTTLTQAFLDANTLADAQRVLHEHETFVSTVLEMPTVQAERFANFEGQIKSLGAWGGDFVMVLSEQSKTDLERYFAAYDCPVLLTWDEMVLA